MKTKTGVRRTQKIDLPLLLETMDRDGWTGNAMEYVERAVISHEELLMLLKSLTTVKLMYSDPKFTVRVLDAIGRAEGR